MYFSYHSQPTTGGMGREGDGKGGGDYEAVDRTRPFILGTPNNLDKFWYFLY